MSEQKERLIVTVQQHILQQQQQFPDAGGVFSWLLSGITLATKMIQAKVRRAGLLDILGDAGEVNVQGETQQKLDIYANEAVHHCLGIRDSVAQLVSEENEEPRSFDGREDAKYIVVFDPLDGSSNIDVNVSVGTTFAVLRRSAGAKGPEAALQPGHQQVAAGYVVYGSSTILVYTTGRGVYGFTLDPAVGAYVLSHDDIKMPPHGDIYSVNEAYIDDFPDVYQRYITGLRRGTFGRRYKSRYIGSMVSDFHRTLLKGGVFLYPPTHSHAEGKLRLLYEANPMAFIAEQAGGKAIDGRRRVLDVQPHSIHQRTPLILGSREEVETFERLRDEG
ncbi:MAG: class 1 fructose-bisphosphatase [Acidobacteria bacterium]|nr:class 1 fructose-bisphosphatase [Acidobacteriota bacterium]